MASALRVFFGLVAIAALTFGLVYRPAAEIKTRQDTTWLLCLLVVGIALLGIFWSGRGYSKIQGSEARLQHLVWRVASLVTVGFILITLQLLHLYILTPEIEKPFETTNSAGEAVLVQDPRRIDEIQTVQRGRIFDASGKEVAGTFVSKSGVVKRTYDTNSSIRFLLGYYNPLRFGTTGLEDSFEDYLNGKTTGNALLDAQRQLLNKPTIGNDLYLTIDPKLQQVANDALGQTFGAIVLLDGNSGAVLAMSGFPRYDPALLVADPTIEDASKRRAYNEQVQKQWEAYNNDQSSPLLFRPTQGLFTPGSIFKTPTLAGMLESGKTTPEATWQDSGFFTIDGVRIADNNRPNQNTTWTTRQGYMFSLNAVFAQMGVQLGKEGLDKINRSFGLEQRIPFDLSTSISKIAIDPTYLNSRPAQAATGFGQGELLVSPLHVALIAAAMGRGDGVIPRPYLVQSVKTRDNSVVKQTGPQVWLQAVRPETASVVRDIMISSATDGYVGLNGGGLPRTGAVVGGKTGTAEVGNGINNAWYMAWASKGDRLFAIAVVIDHKRGGEGLADAMPRANRVLTEALASVK